MKYFIVILILFFSSCHKTEEDKFLNSFKDEKEYRKIVLAGLTEKISEEHLDILNKTDAINEFEFNKNKRYIYGYKSKLNNNTYLLSYTLFYDLPYEVPSIIVAGQKEYWCIYQIGTGVISKIKFFANYPIPSYPEKKNGIITIVSKRPVYIYKETVSGNLIREERETNISKYKIENNRFVEIK